MGAPAPSRVGVKTALQACTAHSVNGAGFTSQSASSLGLSPRGEAARSALSWNGWKGWKGKPPACLPDPLL